MNYGRIESDYLKDLSSLCDELRRIELCHN